MAIEIERKFLVVGDAWKPVVTRTDAMTQGYLAGPPAARCSVRVRTCGQDAWLNIKSASDGICRDEFEYRIPIDDAQRMLATLAGHLVIKQRHHVEVEGHDFEVDVFGGNNSGLVVAEIELDGVDDEFPRPGWLGSEVSHLRRYYNMELASHPYSTWDSAERDAHDAH